MTNIRQFTTSFMQKIILITALISTFCLTGCTPKTPSATDEADQTENVQPAELTQENTEIDANNPINSSTGDEFLISEAGISILVPDGYTLAKNGEINRRGSFASYDFSYKSSFPTFQEIQFFDTESIEKFLDKCEANSPCFFGDYPDLERYNGQKNAFEVNADYQNYALKTFGDRKYFVSNFACTGDGCTIREYTTFIGDKKIDIWITMENASQADASDALFKKFAIK